jgi:sugar phosphate permease
MKRKLLFGATLGCALLSIYAGMFNWTVVQYVFMAACLVLAVAALATPEDDDAPRRPPGG